MKDPEEEMLTLKVWSKYDTEDKTDRQGKKLKNFRFLSPQYQEGNNIEHTSLLFCHF